jgi:hypothetical protein
MAAYATAFVSSSFYIPLGPSDCLKILPLPDTDREAYAFAASGINSKQGYGSFNARPSPYDWRWDFFSTPHSLPVIHSHRGCPLIPPTPVLPTISLRTDSSATTAESAAALAPRTELPSPCCEAAAADRRRLRKGGCLSRNPPALPRSLPAILAPPTRWRARVGGRAMRRRRAAAPRTCPCGAREVRKTAGQGLHLKWMCGAE